MSVLIPTYNRPVTPTIGIDGIPDYLSTDKADPAKWKPSAGHRLRIWCNGRELYHVVEVDRTRGWARTLPYDETPAGPKLQHKDGVTRLYHGVVTLRVERIKIGTREFRRKFLRPLLSRA